MKTKMTLEEVSRQARIAKGLPEHDFAAYGQIGGMARTPAKVAAAKRNGSMGGRKRK